MRKSSCPSQFITKLHLILENRQFSNVVEWNQQQGILHLKDPEVFILQITPLYFKHDSLKSFIRQLNLYGFRKIVRKKQALIFRNPHFTKDNILSGKYLKRNKNKKSNLNIDYLANSQVLAQQKFSYDQKSYNCQAEQPQQKCHIQTRRSKIQSSCFLEHPQEEQSQFRMFDPNVSFEQVGPIDYTLTLGKEEKYQDIFESQSYSQNIMCTFENY